MRNKALRVLADLLRRPDGFSPSLFLEQFDDYRLTIAAAHTNMQPGSPGCVVSLHGARTPPQVSAR